MTPKDSNTAVAVHGLHKRFGSTRSGRKGRGTRDALRDLTFTLPPGGVHALVGRNGAGKSTLFQILLGFLAPSAGESTVLGAPSADLPPGVRGRVAWVTDEHALPGWMSVGALAALQRSHFARWRQETFDSVLGPFQVSPQRQVRELSRGERAGVSLALALAQDPELLLLDEPTLGLDVVAKHAFLDALLEAGDEGEHRRTVVYASHQMDEVERLADDLLVLKAGTLVSHSTPEELWRRIGGWLVEFPTAPDLETLPGVLQARRVEEQWEVVLLDPPRDTPEALRRRGATAVQSISLGLDRALNAFLGAERR